MKKHRYSLNLHVETVAAIDAAAKKAETTRSAIARMFLNLVNHVPVEQLREQTQIPEFFGIKPLQGAKNENARRAK
jgi:hypothetical protein